MVKAMFFVCSINSPLTRLSKNRLDFCDASRSPKAQELSCSTSYSNAPHQALCPPNQILNHRARAPRLREDQDSPRRKQQKPEKSKQFAWRHKNEKIMIARRRIRRRLSMLTDWQVRLHTKTARRSSILRTPWFLLGTLEYRRERRSIERDKNHCCSAVLEL